MDIAKQVFQIHGADETGAVVLRKKLGRAKVLTFFASQPPCVVAMEACGGSHYWAREIAKLGHEVKLIAPKYVKPFVKRQKNDMADAEAICEAAQRPTMRFVAVKSEAEKPGKLTALQARECDLDPTCELPYGPATNKWQHSRPDRWQHSTTRKNLSQNLLASNGASTDEFELVRKRPGQYIGLKLGCRNSLSELAYELLNLRPRRENAHVSGYQVTVRVSPI
jgi:hypothetical protein